MIFIFILFFLGGGVANKASKSLFFSVYPEQIYSWNGMGRQ